jgi:hypothetical protein
MKTFLFFTFACLVSTGALFSALHQTNPFPNFAIAFGSWVVFAWIQARRNRKSQQQARNEQAFRDFMRSKMRN